VPAVYSLVERTRERRRPDGARWSRLLARLPGWEKQS
jgi:hypothetical protein